jgi:hypothetical protein
MILSRDYLGYLCQELVEELAKRQVKLGSPELVLQKVKEAVLNEMTAEDRLNDEVRALLERHAGEMRATGANYQEAFKQVKRQLTKERGVVPASGRDSGDGAKVSRDKIIKLSHVVVDLLDSMKKEVELRAAKNDVRLETVRIFNRLLKIEEEIDGRVRQKIQSQKRQILEGSQEWDILFRKYYGEELKKLGVE